MSRRLGLIIAALAGAAATPFRSKSVDVLPALTNSAVQPPKKPAFWDRRSETDYARMQAAEAKRLRKSIKRLKDTEACKS